MSFNIERAEKQHIAEWGVNKSVVIGLWAVVAIALSWIWSSHVLQTNGRACRCERCETPEPTVCAVCGMHMNQPRTYEEEPPSQWDTGQDEPLPVPTQGVIPFEVERVEPKGRAK